MSIFNIKNNAQNHKNAVFIFLNDVKLLK